MIAVFRAAFVAQAYYLSSGVPWHVDGEAEQSAAAASA
jgi:hypothetical protein